ncbi:hypothetical protein [Microbacterium nymphoidis]|uniref:hypothetical protein n=1 Tax=Microbacterium nymphoidis TaxID=2898586 RepID=UPI001E49FA09|nr:hypothetical protein [Microbacterium nymphoidis]MCD2497971.1 hypothetical protein [Microbacterium nymphoidis]
MTVPPVPAPATRSAERGRAWVRSAAEKVPTTWLTTAGAAIVLLATAAFGGLADAPDPTPVAALGEVIETPGLTLTPIDAEILPRSDPDLTPDRTSVQLTFDVTVTGALPLRTTRTNLPEVVSAIFGARSRAAADLDSAVDVLVRPGESGSAEAAPIEDSDREWDNPLFSASAVAAEVHYDGAVRPMTTLQPGIPYRVVVQYSFADVFTVGTAEIVVWNRELRPGMGVTESRAEKIAVRTTPAAWLSVPLHVGEGP